MIVVIFPIKGEVCLFSHLSEIGGAAKVRFCGKKQPEDAFFLVLRLSQRLVVRVRETAFFGFKFRVLTQIIRRKSNEIRKE